MKEKIKNFFKNENLWSTIVEIFCSILLVCVGYFSGFSAGLFVDDNIRDEIIDKTTDELKKPKIENEKKSLVDNGNYNYTFTNEDLLTIGKCELDGKTFLLGVEFVITYNIYYDNYNYTDTFLLNYIDFSYYVVTFDIIDDLFISTKTYYTNDGSSTLEKNQAFSGTWRYTSGLEYSSFYANSYLTFILEDGIPTGDIGLVTYINNDNSYIYDSNYLYSDYYSSTLFALSNYLVTSDTSYMLWIFSQQLYTCENNLQNKAIINVSMFQNLFDVFDIFHGGATEEELEESYWQGYNDRKNSVEESESTINSIWGIIEKGVSSVLEVLNIQILPGIPLYICIIVPIILGVLLWVIKLGAQ